MGADIHLWVEKRCGNAWTFANQYWLENFESESWIDWDAPYTERNYFLFSILAGVRNHNNPLTPILPVRGTPIDVSEIGARIIQEWGADAHTHSWFSTKELLSYPWNEIVNLRGFVKTFDAIQWKNHQNPPSSWLYEPWNDYVTQLDWHQSKASLCGGFVDDFLPKMPNYGSIEETRVVFFFDN